MMVRVPGQPVAVRVYAEVAHGEAARYAAQAGGEVVSLSLSPPHGYTADSTGTLVPSVLPGSHPVSA